MRIEGIGVVYLGQRNGAQWDVLSEFGPIFAGLNEIERNRLMVQTEEKLYTYYMVNMLK